MRNNKCIPIFAVFAAIIGYVVYIIQRPTFVSLAVMSGVAVSILAFLLMNVILGGKTNPLNIQANLRKVGLVNKFGEAPFLVKTYRNDDCRNGFVLEFENRGIAREKFEDKKADIEAALDVWVEKIKDGKNRRRVRIYAVSAKNGLPSCIQWDNKYYSHVNYEIVLGQSLLGLAKVNLLDSPHILIGGATGSGKSVLLKLILAQCVSNHNAKVHIADFKGGVDFPQIWHEKCNMIFDEQTLVEVLKDVIAELETRKNELKKTGCANIAEYNNRVKDEFRPIIIACDEVAELLDDSACTKDEKAVYRQITRYLATIARQGRAFGIHLILATQRASVDVIPPQVKSNISYRICGRADNVLSMIVLDKTDAADVVPKDAKGRFLTSDDTVFQGFLYSDEQL